MPAVRPYSAAFDSAIASIEPAHLAHREERHEQLLAEQRAREREPRDGRRDEVALVEDAAPEPLAAEDDGALTAGPGRPRARTARPTAG